MKFGKQKAEQKENKNSDDKPSKKKNKVSLRSPFIYVGFAALIAAVCVAAAIYGYQTVVIVPLKNELRNDVAKSHLNALRLVFNEKLTSLQTLVEHYTAGVSEQTFATAQAARKLQAETAVAALPDSVRALFSLRGRAIRDSGSPLPVSFASLDLIRSVEESQQAKLEAFAVAGKWYVQVVAPRLNGDNEVIGTLLVMFDANTLQPDWSVLPQGSVQLLQRVGDADRPVIKKGTASPPVLTAPLQLAGWSVGFVPEHVLKRNVDQAILAGSMLVGGLLAAALVAAIFAAFLGRIKTDIRLFSAYVLAIIDGESPAQPAIKLSLLQSLVVMTGQSMRLSKQYKGSIKSTADRQQKSAAGVAPATPEALDAVADEQAQVAAGDTDDRSELGDAEPLFQGDSLDIDMLEDDDLLGLEDDALDSQHSESGDDFAEVGDEETEVAEEIFRAYDIRGVFGDTLTAPVMLGIGRALGSEAISRGAMSICVGRDGRQSSPELAQSLIKGLVSTGLKVVDIGMVPTPVLYFAIEQLAVDAGAMVTGSHNAPEYNGLKMVINGDTLAEADTFKIYARIQAQDYVTKQGELTTAEVTTEYIDRIISDIAVAAPLKVVVDAGNGVAGELAPELLAELGCEVIPLHCEIDGLFPNHHPDPGKAENLQDLIAKVKETEAHIGIALDGDGDRIGVVSNSGEIIWPDRLLMLFAKDVVSRNPGADVVFDVKCSRRLSSLISGFGGRPVMWRSGHSMLKAKMKETGALLGGELSGHMFFKERWSGFDDGLYSAARLLEILGIDDRDAHTVFGEFPEDVSTPALLMEVSESEKFSVVEELIRQGDWGDATVTTLDGVRVDYTDGWGLCRASNTTPDLMFRFEAETEAGLQRIQDVFRKQFAISGFDFELPF